MIPALTRFGNKGLTATRVVMCVMQCAWITKVQFVLCKVGWIGLDWTFETEGTMASRVCSVER
jgi:hypothetical protein